MMDGLRSGHGRGLPQENTHLHLSGFYWESSSKDFGSLEDKSKAGGEALGLLGAERRRGLGRTGAA